MTLETGDIKALIATLHFILSQAARNAVDGTTLLLELEQLGLPKDVCTAIVREYATAKDELRAVLMTKTLSRQHLRPRHSPPSQPLPRRTDSTAPLLLPVCVCPVPQVTEMDWRVDYVLSSTALQTVDAPFVRLNFRLSKAAPASGSTTLPVEMTAEQFVTLYAGPCRHAASLYQYADRLLSQHIPLLHCALLPQSCEQHVRSWRPCSSHHSLATAAATDSQAGFSTDRLCFPCHVFPAASVTGLLTLPTSTHTNPRQLSRSAMVAALAAAGFHSTTSLNPSACTRRVSWSSVTVMTLPTASSYTRSVSSVITMGSAVSAVNLPPWTLSMYCRPLRPWTFAAEISLMRR